MEERMTPRTLSRLAILTAIVVVIATWAVVRTPTVSAPDKQGELMLGGLINELDDLKTVTVRHKEGKFTFDLDNGNWKFVDRGGYPVNADKMAELLITMARLEKLEPKTKLENRYQRLDLNDPSEKDSRAKHVTLLTDTNKKLADLIVGKRKFTLGSDEGGVYVRQPEDSQTWLVRGELNPGNRPRDWLMRDITDIKDEDIRRVVVTQADGDVLAVSKESSGQKDFAVEKIPAGRELRRETIANDHGRVLSSLLLDDVTDDKTMAFPQDNVITAVFEGWEGFAVTMWLAEVDGNNWVKVRGDLLTSIPEDVVSDEARPGLSAEASPTVKTNAKDWPAVIDEINTRSRGWIYQVPGYEISALKRRMTEMLKEVDAGG